MIKNKNELINSLTKIQKDLYEERVEFDTYVYATYDKKNKKAKLHCFILNRPFSDKIFGIKYYYLAKFNFSEARYIHIDTFKSWAEVLLNNLEIEIKKEC